MRKSTKTIGDMGESIAEDYLLKQGYKILERNFRADHYEVDIIAAHNHVLAFVEVKTSNSTKFDQPLTWVDDRKQCYLGRCAEIFIDENEIRDMDCRFDVIVVNLTQRPARVIHLKNAFWLDD